MHLNVMDATGQRVRRDITPEELAALPAAERALAPGYIATLLDDEEIRDELASAERELRRLQALEDQAILAAPQEARMSHADALRAVIAAHQNR